MTQEKIVNKLENDINDWASCLESLKSDSNRRIAIAKLYKMYPKEYVRKVLDLNENKEKVKRKPFYFQFNIYKFIINNQITSLCVPG